MKEIVFSGMYFLLQVSETTTANFKVNFVYQMLLRYKLQIKGLSQYVAISDPTVYNPAPSLPHISNQNAHHIKETTKKCTLCSAG